MATFTALFDACVLYPASLSNLLMHLAMSDLFRARWTEKIHDEWIEALLAKRPHLERAKLERRRELMNRNAQGCLVTGYEALIEGLELPDPDDRHVLAAALRTRAHVIVTYNTKDFPDAVLHPLGLEAQHPDLFLAHLLDLAPGPFCAAVKRMRESLRNPERTALELLDSFARQQLPDTVARLIAFEELL